MATSGTAANDERLHLLRRVALIITAVGAASSVALMIRAADRTPALLIVLFIGWVLAPFVVLFWANVASARWSTSLRVALVWVTIVVALGSVVVYGGLVDVRPPGAPNAFPFVITAPAAILLIAITAAIVALTSRKPPRRR